MSGVERARRGISVGLGILLIFTMGPGAPTSLEGQAIGSPLPAATPSTSTYPGQGAPATAEELQSLVAPIALYPDSLAAQILSAATFPDQVAVANYWVEQNKSLTGSALMSAV